MELSIVWMYLGFFLAAYSVIANDSIQTLGTFLSANKEYFSWKTLWLAASTMLVFTISYARVMSFDFFVYLLYVCLCLRVKSKTVIQQR